MKILIVNGPNLNLLGRREIEIYGNTSFEMMLEQLREEFTEVNFHYYQSNHEGALLDFLHEEGWSADGIIINAGGYSHTSVALADAVAALARPTVEVHISNVFARENYRHHSFLTPKCVGSIVGLGLDGYRLAVIFLMRKLAGQVLG